MLGSIGLFVIVAAGTVSCGKAPNNGNWPPHHAWETEPQLSDDLHINLFLDASQSMQGFLAPGSENRYLPLLEQLESLAGNGAWRNGKTKWWRFGENVVEVLPKDRLLFRSAAFYTETKTNIEKIFDISQPGDLTVIVTDLFQSRADVALLSGHLDAKYLAGMRQAKDHESPATTPAVAVLGIETRFNGRVSELYDTNGVERSVPHTGTLPYYVLILGNLPDVERYLQRIDAHFPDLGPHSQRVLFTERMVRHLDTKAKLGIKRDGYSLEKNLIPGPAGQDERILQLQVPAQGVGKLTDARHLDATLECDLLSNGLPLDLSMLLTSVKSEKAADDGSFKADPQLDGVLRVSAVKLEGKQLKLALELARDHMLTGHDYRFEVRVFPAEEASHLSKQILEWDLLPSEVDQILAQKGFAKGKPGRTLNLGTFLLSLRDATFSQKKPPIGILYLYVKAT
jgi:hypothetical protein